jgi:ATPase subunit of ABC transporter with duplicated ATPase domains
MDRAHIEAIVDGSLRAVGFEAAEVAGRSPFELSFGEMRRVAFAIAHALAPDLLLLDEPASCLDRAGRAVLEALVTARLDQGAAVVIASHDPSHLENLCTACSNRDLSLDLTPRFRLRLTRRPGQLLSVLTPEEGTRIINHLALFMPARRGEHFVTVVTPFGVMATST